jgi:beta-phosphoglucomutase family hydrolase
MIKGLIFDMDDTLVDSLRVHRAAFKQALKNHKADISKIPEEVEATFPGRKGIEIAKYMVEYFSLDITPEALVKERNELVEESLKKVKPMPGFYKLMSFLNKKTIKFALASSGTRAHIKTTLKAVNIENSFDAIVSGDEVHKSKPEPDIFLLAAKKLNLNPEECAVIEDAFSGIRAAKKAGMKAIGIYHKQPVTKQDLSEADVILDNLGEIEEKIKEL